MTTTVELTVRPTPTGFMVVTIGYTRWRVWCRPGDVLDQFAVLNLAREIAATGRRLKFEIIADGLPVAVVNFHHSRNQFYSGSIDRA